MLRTFATLALAAALGGCATPYKVGTPVADGGTVALLPGASASLPDGLLRYVRLASDSRCPANVQCVWAGDAALAMRWTPASGAAQDFELHTTLDPKSFDAGGRSITLQSLERGDAPKATLQVDAAH